MVIIREGTFGSSFFNLSDILGVETNYDAPTRVYIVLSLPNTYQ